MNNQSDFTHMDKRGQVRMSDVGGKKSTHRMAVAKGFIILAPKIVEKIKTNQVRKGDVLGTAKISGISAAKRTWELIPLCHQVRLDYVGIDLKVIEEKNRIEAVSTVRGFDVTGVEMEALVAASVALLSIYDMCKGISKDMSIGGVELMEKTGGKSDYYKKY